MTTTDPYADVVRDAAEDVIRQMIDGGAPSRQHNYRAANGDHYPSVRVYFADIYAIPAHGIPAGVARVVIDVSPTRGRQPAHEVDVFLDPAPACPVDIAADLAGAVLEMLDPTADYAR
jgi:hypothetical protein